MTTFKTLIRKSDGQYIKIKDSDLIFDVVEPVLLPDNTELSDFFDVEDIENFELVECALIPVDDLPEHIQQNIKIRDAVITGSYSIGSEGEKEPLRFGDWIFSYRKLEKMYSDLIKIVCNKDL